MAESYAFFHHGQHGLFPFCWTGGQGTDPNEQNTQQSPANGLSFCSAALADIEELTGIGRHLLGGLKAALRTGENGFELHRYLASPVDVTEYRRDAG